MSTFDHTGLINDINASLAPFRKAQPDAMAGFGQLARASMTDGAISAKNKELGLHWFSRQGAAQTGMQPR